MNSIVINSVPVNLYAKTNKDNAYRVNGQIYVEQSAEMSDFMVTVGGVSTKASVKRKEDGTPKQNENSNYGWRVNVKVVVDSINYQCNLHITPVKMSGRLPVSGTYKCQVTGDMTAYVPKREQAAAKTETKPTVKPVKPTQKATDHDALLNAAIMKLLAS